MAAYIFFQRLSTTDASELAYYVENLGPAIEGHPIKVLAFGTTFENVEGPATESAVLVEFPTVADAKKWYNSEKYTALRQHRIAGGEHMGVIFQGNE